jgi:hypothetical protein
MRREMSIEISYICYLVTRDIANYKIFVVSEERENLCKLTKQDSISTNTKSCFHKPT